ncbi:MAG: L,D-transpeptidase [Pseudoxanthomonas sp.]
MPRFALHLFAALLLPVSSVLAAADAPAVPDPRALKPGQYLWHPEIAPEGPIVVVVSLDEQRAYVYRNGVAIGVSTISSGKPGKETPTGVFTILQKNKDHYSNLYNNAPMPYMQRLTWGGIALHGGSLPGYPASHGCVRLPHVFAQKLFAETRTGDTVVVADAKASAASLTRPALLAPVNETGTELATQNVHAGYFWDEAAANAPGPVNVLVSVADRRVFVLRNGVVVGEAGLHVADDFALHGSVLMVKGDDAAQPWTTWPVVGIAPEALTMLQLQLQTSRPLQVDPDFSDRVRSILQPGATLLLTDLPAMRPDPTQPMAPVLESDEVAGDE